MPCCIPETPASQIGPEKQVPKPRPNRIVPEGSSVAPQDKAGKSAKVTKALGPVVQEGQNGCQGAGAKKKNRSSAPEGRQADARIEPWGPGPGSGVSHVPAVILVIYPRDHQRLCLYGLEAAPPTAAALPTVGVTVVPAPSQPNRELLPEAAGTVSLACPFQPDSGGWCGSRVFAGFFGVGFAFDAFVVAFRIPNLLRDLFAEGALSLVFVTVFTDYEQRLGQEKTWQLANNVVFCFTLLLSLLVMAGHVVLPGISWGSWPRISAWPRGSWGSLP